MNKGDAERGDQMGTNGRGTRKMKEKQKEIGDTRKVKRNTRKRKRIQKR
jgi:hypothetical protein